MDVTLYMVTFVMLKFTIMNERIREFLTAENKSSAQLAEEIGVQPSGISHILSGRNNPSLDFILKMLEKYQFLSTEWLLFGKGSMYKESKMQTLFDVGSAENADNESIQGGVTAQNSDSDHENVQNVNLQKKVPSSVTARSAEVERIVWFYTDNSFEEYYPSNS